MVGISRVLEWEVRNDEGSNGRSVTKGYSDILSHLEDLGGKKMGKHKLQCRLSLRKAVSKGYHQQKMYMLRTSENEEMTFTLLINERLPAAPKTNVQSEAVSRIIGTENEDLVLLECGLDGAVVLDGLEIYSSKLDGQFEGTKYRIGDFCVNVCTYKNRNDVPKAIVVEIQYLPVCTYSKGEKILDEFQSLLGFAVGTGGSENGLRKVVEAPEKLFEKAKLPSTYTLRHTALQYIAVFNHLR